MIPRQYNGITYTVNKNKSTVICADIKRYSGYSVKWKKQVVKQKCIMFPSVYKNKVCIYIIYECTYICVYIEKIFWNHAHKKTFPQLSISQEKE